MILQTLNQNQQTVSPVVKVVAKLDDEITNILSNKDLNDYDKAKVYAQTLQKYLSTRENIDESKPAPEVTVVADSSNYNDSAIVNTVPKKYQQQARNLLHFIKTDKKITWAEDGAVSLDDVPLQDSNIVDLINDAVRLRKTFQPNGWRNFASMLRKINTPSNLIGNPLRRGTPQIVTPVRRVISRPHTTRRRKTLHTKWSSL